MSERLRGRCCRPWKGQSERARRTVRPAPGRVRQPLAVLRRDGFVGLRLRPIIAAWWDRFGADLPRERSKPADPSDHPSLERALRAAVTAVRNVVVGLPAERLRRSLGIAVNFASASPYASRTLTAAGRCSSAPPTCLARSTGCSHLAAAGVTASAGSYKARRLSTARRLAGSTSASRIWVEVHACPVGTCFRSRAQHSITRAGNAMCGIVGQIRFDGRDVGRPVLERMCVGARASRARLSWDPRR